jgi:preprotein translocase subunit SecD
MSLSKVIGVLALTALGTSFAMAADPPRAKVEFRRAETKAAEGLTEAKIAGSDTKVYLHKEVDLTNDDIAQVRVNEDKERGVSLEMTFTKEGAKKAAKLSEEHADKPVAILVDGKVISALTVRAKFGEKVAVSGNFTKIEAEKLAKSIKPE